MTPTAAGPLGGSQHTGESFYHDHHARDYKQEHDNILHQWLPGVEMILKRLPGTLALLPKSTVYPAGWGEVGKKREQGTFPGENHGILQWSYQNILGGRFIKADRTTVYLH